MRQNLQILSTESSKVKDKFKLSDEKLILRFQEGDINAYNELVKRYKDRLLNFVFRYFNNREQAEDVVQDTLIKLYTHASYYKNIAKFSTWIYTIAGNLAKTELKLEKSRVSSSHTLTFTTCSRPQSARLKTDIMFSITASVCAMMPPETTSPSTVGTCPET